MKRTLLWLVPAAALVLALAGAAFSPQSAESSSPVKNEILAHKLAVELGKAQAKPWEMPVSGGVMTAVLEQTGITAQRAAALSGGRSSSLSPSHHGGGISRARTEGCQNTFHGHGMTNIRVNQDCSLRRQAEEAIQRSEEHTSELQSPMYLVC